jgi:hypothetical protein
METVLIILFHIFCGIVCWFIATSKGRTGWWFLAGLFLSIIGILLLVVASDEKQHTELQERLSRFEREALSAAKYGFKDAVTWAAADIPSLCLRCYQYAPVYSICRRFKQEVADPVEQCSEFRESQHPNPELSPAAVATEEA